VPNEQPIRHAKAIFAEAAEIASRGEREAYLDRACADDPNLHRQVEVLLQALGEAGNFLESPVKWGPETAESDATTPGSNSSPSDDNPTITGIEPIDATGAFTPEQSLDTPSARSMREGQGSLIGPYKLLQRIGEGGMGAVYLAEQERPVRRRVALKVIKPGMDTEQVVARFEAERQALAIMDHPSIAKVFDAGVTDSGRPYFVMELVKGVPITEYCDAVHLTPKERLELFIPVCQAIQHAHQKGIIHRDIKPSNVLVAMQDGKPVPKVIDFGIAKAIDQRLTEKTFFTQHGAIIGTLEYMSPEQAEISAMDIDTRADIYALGVLLYELLTGSTPLERVRLREAGYSEILRRIREEEPPKPSTRLSESRDSLPSVAALRKTEPARLARLLRGDLDWIVMKALEKDRTRRYESASGFARDIERHLLGDPVEAGPPSAVYRLRKYASKHRGALVTALSFGLVLTLATIVSGVSAVSAARDRDKARDALEKVTEAKEQTEAALMDSEQARSESQAVSDFLVSSFRKPDPTQDGAKILVVDLLDGALARLGTDLAESPATHAKLLDALGQTYYGLGQWAKASDTFAKAVGLHEKVYGRDHPETLIIRGNLAMSLASMDKLAQATAIDEELLPRFISAFGPNHPKTVAIRGDLAGLYNSAGNFKKAIELAEDALKPAEVAMGPADRLPLKIRATLAAAYRYAGRVADAITLYESTLKIREATLGPNNIDTLDMRTNLALAYDDFGKAENAVTILKDTLPRMQSTLGPDHPLTLTTYASIGRVLATLRRSSEAIPILEESLRRFESTLGPRHGKTLVTRATLGGAYQDVGRIAEATVAFEVAFNTLNAVFGANHPNTLATRALLADAYLLDHRFLEALAMQKELIKVAELTFGIDHPNTTIIRANLASAYLAAGQFDAAEAEYRRFLEKARSTFGPEDSRTELGLGRLGSCLVKQQKWAAAEPIVRELLSIREKTQPDGWSTFSARSALGECLVGQSRFAEAEAAVLGGYDGMKARADQIAPDAKPRLTDAAARIVQLYQAWDKPKEAAEWRTKLAREAGLLIDMPPDVFAPR
jgi:eukaryotic-like serine/threonine-protein kinase